VSVQAAFAEQARTGGRAALVTVLRFGPQVGAKLLVRADGTSEGTLGDRALDGIAVLRAHEAMWTERSESVEEGDVLLFIDVVAPPPRLILFGAVDFAAQLAALASLTGWRTFVVDPRSRFAVRERFPGAERVIAAWPEEALAQIDPIDAATAMAVLTHDPKLDDAALTLALRSEAGYVGAMGSHRAQERRRERLLAAGLTDAELDRLAAPIGLDLGALTAEETALSVMAELVAVRHGRSGGRLQHADGRIHEAAA
jgi:xanthine dehydrogenase accessory factor